MLKPIPLHYTESSRLLANDQVDIEAARLSKDQAHGRGVVNLLASILGTGLLSMPGACMNSGILIFCFGSLLACFACHTTACFLVRTVKFLASRNGGDDATYARLANQVFGAKGERIIQYGLVLQQIGACVGYIVVIGDVFSPLMRYYFDIGHSETVIRNIFVWFLMFPLTVGVKDLGSLSFASAIAVFAICLFSVTVIGNYFFILGGADAKRAELLCDTAKSLRGPFLLPQELPALLTSIPLICFAYDMHFNVVPIHEDMKMDIMPPFSPVQVFSSASLISFTLSFMVTVLTGFSGYATFLSATEPDILMNFSVRDTYIALLMNIVRAFYGIGLALAFPMIVWELRQVIFVLVWGTDSTSTGKFWGVTAFIFALTSLLVLVVGDVTTVFGLVGSTVTPTLDYIFPSLLYLRSGCAAKYNDEIRARFTLFCGVLLVPTGLGVWIYNRLQN